MFIYDDNFLNVHSPNIILTNDTCNMVKGGANLKHKSYLPTATHSYL